MARPLHQPLPALRRHVEAMAGFGVPETDLARAIGIDPKTLRNHYREELDTGHVKANARVAENLYRKATGEGREAVTAAIFWLKTRAGWRETNLHEVGGREGHPVEIALQEPARETVARRLREMSQRADQLTPPPLDGHSDA